MNIRLGRETTLSCFGLVADVRVVQFARPVPLGCDAIGLGSWLSQTYRFGGRVNRA